MRQVFLVCGVPGSGKTWACKRASHRFHYIAHDDYIGDEDAYLKALTDEYDRPVLTECPFGERVLRQKIEFAGGKVTPVFVVETPVVVQERYQKRRGTLPAPNVLTRAVSIRNRAKEWEAFWGNSKEVLDYLLGER